MPLPQRRSRRGKTYNTEGCIRILGHGGPWSPSNSQPSTNRNQKSVGADALLCCFGLSAYFSLPSTARKNNCKSNNWQSITQLAMVGEWFHPKPNRMQRGKRAGYQQSQGTINHRNNFEFR